MMMKAVLRWAMVVAVLAATPIALGDDRERVAEHLAAQEWREAARTIERLLDDSPDDAGLLYDLARAYSRMGRRDAAADALYQAVQAGFRDFDRMRDDADLEAIRDHETYRAIVEAVDRVAKGEAERTPPRGLGETGDAVLDAWRAKYGTDGYRFAVDEEHKLAYAIALDETAEQQMRAMLAKQADAMMALLFDDPPEGFVLIAVPTPKHAREIFDQPSHAGVYDHDQRALVVRDIGRSLRHEFLHAYHHAHMDRLGQNHPLWIQEGLATLFEAYVIEDGAVRFLPNDRLPFVQRRVRSNLHVPWSRLAEMPAEQFMARAGHLYPQVRSMFRFLAEEGRLEAWYDAYIAGYGDDPTGLDALRKVFGGDLDEIEARWRRWVTAQPAVDDQIEEGDASLGIQAMRDGASDGVVIERVLPGSGAWAAGLRAGDVIVSIGERAVRSLAELRGVIGGREVGETVDVTVRRDGEYVQRRVTLRPLR